jgi:hypothetical protein
MLKKNKILKYVGRILMAIGFIGWFGSSAIDFCIPDYWELPLGYVRGLAVDNNGRIFCGLQSYSAIQVYDKNGNFIKRWKTNSTNFKLTLDEKDQLHVATARQGFHYVFDAQGNLLQKQENALQYFQEISTDEQQYKWRDRRGDIYKIEPYSLIFPQITKTTIAGQTSTIISTPIYKWLVMEPFPAWFFIVFGIIISSAISKLSPDIFWKEKN